MSVEDIADLKPVFAALTCCGTHDKAMRRGVYFGVRDCLAAKISAGSVKRCSWGCQGFGDCVKVCKAGAISIGENGIPRVDAAFCNGCKACMKECPQNLIVAIPRDFKGGVRVFCSNRDANKTMVANNCKAACIKCGFCVKNCPEQCIKMVDGIPVIDNERCTKCGICVNKCSTKAMNLVFY